MKKKTKKEEVTKVIEEPTTIPIESVPHLYNAQMLKWQRAHFSALRSIYEKLEEILISQKE